MSRVAIRFPGDADGVRRAAEWLRRGGLLIVPTETFYGLSVDPRQAAAVAEIFLLKRRDRSQALPLIAGSREQVERCCPGWSAERLAARLADWFWPGPLSLILRAGSEPVPEALASDGTAAVRWSSHPLAAALALAHGFPIVATSANLSGAPPCSSPDQAWSSLGARAEHAVLDGGPTPGGLASTLVRVDGEQLHLVRPGAISLQEIESAIG